jgi:uncharacterized protein (TIGR03067 family)
MPRQIVVLLICGLPLTFVQASTNDAEDHTKLEGTWTFVEQENQTKKKEKRPAMRIVFEGTSIAFAAEGKKPAAQGHYKVDPTKNPKTMDIILEQQGKKTTTLAIYDLSGDTLRICHFLGPSSFKERPKEFIADKNTVIGTLRRAKK